MEKEILHPQTHIRSPLLVSVSACLSWAGATVDI